MKPQDHSDTTLLVWSDWLEENGEEQKAYDLREEIASHPAEKWSYEQFSRGGYLVGSDRGDSVGGGFGGMFAGANHFGGRVGCADAGRFSTCVGGIGRSANVGGGANIG